MLFSCDEGFSTESVNLVDVWGGFSAVVALLAARVGDNDDKFDGDKT